MHLVISYSGALGGGERVLVELAPVLAGDSWLACPPGPLADEAAARGFRVLPLGVRRLELRGGPAARLLAGARLVAHAREARALVDALAPDVVIAWGMRSLLSLWIAGVCRRAPVVFQHNDLLPGPLIGMLVRAAAGSASRVLALSETIAADLDPCGRLGSRMTVVQPGVDVDAFDAVSGPSDPPEVLVLGAIVAWKRPDLALEAVALARARFPQLRLRVVGAPIGAGGDELLARLQRRASLPDLAGAVELCGPLADPKPALTRATCLLHCAPREPFGLVMLEALAAGRPVVAPAAGGPTEIVDPSCGILYPPADAAAAAAAIVSIVHEPQLARAMGSHGRIRVRERFSAERARDAFASAIAPLIDPSPSKPRAGALALLTVTHNSAPELDALLDSVARHLSAASVIVVDNASRDDTLAVAERWRGRGRLRVSAVALARNIGFGAACNRGMELVHEPIVALINPDVELVDDSLLALAAQAARADAPPRLLAPLVLRADGRRENSAHPLPCSPAELVHALVPPAALCDRAAAVIAPWRSNRARPVGWAVGCALLARTDTLRRLGPFDQSIFLYGEDLDLCLRAREQGIETWFWPQARVLHHGAHASAPAFGGEPFERLAAARHAVVARRLGRRAALADDALQALTFASRLALKRALHRDTARERSRLQAVLGARRSSQTLDPARR